MVSMVKWWHMAIAAVVFIAITGCDTLHGPSVSNSTKCDVSVIIEMEHNGICRHAKSQISAGESHDFFSFSQLHIVKLTIIRREGPPVVFDRQELEKRLGIGFDHHSFLVKISDIDVELSLIDAIGQP